MAPKTLLVGFGKIGKRIAQELKGEHELWALSRRAKSHVQELGLSNQVHAIEADLTQADSLKGQIPKDINYLVYCVSPFSRDEQGYRSTYYDGFHNVLKVLESSDTLKHVFFVSSTSVYHQDDHSWVDESSVTLPSSYSGKILLEAEALAKGGPYAHSVVRFSGIYGGSRSNLRNQVREGRSVLSSSPRLTNRIHEDDCVGFLVHLLRQADSGEALAPLYLATDDEPCDMNEVLSLIAEQEQVSLTTSSEPPKRRTGNKKCSNALMRKSGYELSVPSYRVGYDAP